MADGEGDGVDRRDVLHGLAVGLGGIALGGAAKAAAPIPRAEADAAPAY